MKNKALKTIINVIIGIVCVALFVWLYVGMDEEFFPSILYAVLGVLAFYLINAIVHELAHVISGAIAGLKPYSVQILNLFIGKDESGKFKVCFKRSYGELGSTVLMPKNSEKVFEKHVISAFCALLSNLIVMVVQCVVALTTSSLFVYSFIGVSFPITLYIFLVNLIPVFENDGRLVVFFFTGGEDVEIAKNYYTAVSDLTLGQLPENLNSTLLIKIGNGAYSAGIRYLRYLAYLKNDEESAFKELELIPSDNEPYMLFDEIEKEKFFIAMIKDNANYVNQFSGSIVGLIEDNKTPSDYRIHAVYRIRTGDIEWAKLILNSGIEFCKTYPNIGLALSEKAYMETLKNQLN